MKHKSRYRLDRELFLSRRRHKIEQKRKGIKYSVKAPNSEYLFKGEIIHAPKMISIYEVSEDSSDPYTETIEFIEKIENTIRKKPCIITFKDTFWMSAAAMIVLYATIEEAQKHGAASADLIWSHNASVNRKIRATNLSKLIRNKPIRYNFKNGKPLPVISSSSNEHMEDIIDYIQERVYRDEMTPEIEHLYGDAVSETINNVNLHAYPDNKGDDQKWWLLCLMDQNELYLAIYDKGVGIPKTVVDKPWIVTSMKSAYPEEYKELMEQYPQLRDYRTILLNKLSDPQLIYLSMKGNVSGTKQSKHGQGSKSIKKLVRDTSEGKLWVFSNNGLYVFEEDEETPELYELPQKLAGTLVQWNIKVS